MPRSPSFSTIRRTAATLAALTLAAFAFACSSSESPGDDAGAQHDGAGDTATADGASIDGATTDDTTTDDTTTDDTGPVERATTLLVEQEIGSEGGTLVASERGLTLQIPAGAFTTPTTVRVVALEPPAGKNDRVAADPWGVPTRRFRIEPAGVELGAPAWFSIKAPAAEVPLPATAFDISIDRFEGGVWTPITLDPAPAAFDYFPPEPRRSGTTTRLGEIALRLTPPYQTAPTLHHIRSGGADVSDAAGPKGAIGPGGLLTAWGHGYGWDCSRVQVTIGGTKVPASNCSNARVDFPFAVTQPTFATDVAVRVEVDGVQSPPLTVTIAGLNSGQPKISGVSPQKAALRGTWIRLQGTFYGSDTTRRVLVGEHELQPWRDDKGQDWALLPDTLPAGPTTIRVHDGIGGPLSEPFAYHIMAHGTLLLDAGAEAGGLWLPGSWAAKGQTAWQPDVDLWLGAQNVSGAAPGDHDLRFRVVASGGGAPAIDTGFVGTLNEPWAPQPAACHAEDTGHCAVPLPPALLVGRGAGGTFAVTVQQSVQAYLGDGTPNPALQDVVRTSNTVTIAIAGRSHVGAYWLTSAAPASPGASVDFCPSWNQPRALGDMVCVQAGVQCDGVTCAASQAVLAPGLWSGAIPFRGGGQGVGVRGRCAKLVKAGTITLLNSSLGASCKLLTTPTGGGAVQLKLEGLHADEAVALSLGGGALEIPAGALPALPEGQTYSINLEAPKVGDPSNPGQATADPQLNSELGAYRFQITPQPKALAKPITLQLPLAPDKLGLGKESADLALIHGNTGETHLLQASIDVAAAVATVILAAGTYEKPVAKPSPSAPEPVLPVDFNVAFGEILVIYREDEPGVLEDAKGRVRVEYVVDPTSKDVESKDDAANVLERAVQTWAWLEDNGWKTPKKPLRILLRKTVSWASSTAKGATSSGFFGQPQVTLRTDLGPAEARYVVAHEVAHAFQRSYTTNFTLSWLDEGAADWVAWKVGPADYDLGGINDQGEAVKVVGGGIPSGWGGVEKSDIYASTVWLMWLAETHGESTVRNIYQALDWSPTLWASAHKTLAQVSGLTIGSFARAFAEAFWLQKFEPLKTMSLSTQLTTAGAKFTWVPKTSKTPPLDLSARPPLASLRYRLDISLATLGAIGEGAIVLRAQKLGPQAEVAVFAEAGPALDPSKPTLLARLTDSDPVLVVPTPAVGSTFLLHNRWASEGTATGAVLLLEVPRIKFVSPSKAKEGELVTIGCQEVGGEQGTLRVGGTVVTPTSWSGDEVRFTMPDFPNTQKVTVVLETADGGKTNAAELLVGP